MKKKKKRKKKIIILTGKKLILKRNVRKSDLTQEELEILKCLSKPEEAYKCGYCQGFLLISFSIVKDPRDRS